ncbi:MAG: ABC transporter substrate-binding protein [Acidimicrobiia bacterium]
MKVSTGKVAAVSLAGLLLLAACGDDGDSTSATTAAASGSTAAAGAGVDLKAAGCPETVKIITDWAPEAEHGFLYQMFGADAAIDAKGYSVSGKLMASGKETGVNLQVISGGPLRGFSPPTSEMYQDESILLGFVYTDEGIQFSASNPTVGVVAPFVKSPQAIAWDPATYPDVKTVADLGTKGVKVRYFDSAAYMEFVVESGILKREQVSGDYDGSPSLFVADGGKSATQIFASAEPYLWSKEVPEWGKPISYQYIDDLGWKPYAQSLATKPDNITKYKDCFTKLVPVIQQATVDYVTNPATTNALIVKTVKEFGSSWEYSEGVAAYAGETMKNDKLIANSPSGTLGDFDLARVTDLITKATPIYTAGGKAPKAGLTAEDVVTNQFIDKSIKLG